MPQKRLFTLGWTGLAELEQVHAALLRPSLSIEYCWNKLAKWPSIVGAIIEAA